MTRADRERTNKQARVQREAATLGARAWDRTVSPMLVNRGRRGKQTCQFCPMDRTGKGTPATHTVNGFRFCERHLTNLMALAFRAGIHDVAGIPIPAC